MPCKEQQQRLVEFETTGGKIDELPHQVEKLYKDCGWSTEHVKFEIIAVAGILEIEGRSSEIRPEIESKTTKFSMDETTKALDRSEQGIEDDLDHGNDNCAVAISSIRFYQDRRWLGGNERFSSK